MLIRIIERVIRFRFLLIRVLCIGRLRRCIPLCVEHELSNQRDAPHQRIWVVRTAKTAGTASKRHGLGNMLANNTIIG